jgi:hypothetical protein
MPDRGKREATTAARIRWCSDGERGAYRPDRAWRVYEAGADNWGSHKTGPMAVGHRPMGRTLEVTSVQAMGRLLDPSSVDYGLLTVDCHRQSAVSRGTAARARWPAPVSGSASAGPCTAEVREPARRPIVKLQLRGTVVAHHLDAHPVDAPGIDRCPAPSSPPPWRRNRAANEAAESFLRRQYATSPSVKMRRRKRSPNRFSASATRPISMASRPLPIMFMGRFHPT